MLFNSLPLCLFLAMAGAQVTTENPPAAPQPQNRIPAAISPTGAVQAQPAVRITLDDAIRLALENSPAMRAARTQIAQSQAEEITAGLRPNPSLSWDSQFIPIFTPSQFSSDTLNNFQQFDVGVGYLFERGGKRQARSRAAQDQTAVTRSQIADAERALRFNVAQQYINALLAQSTLRFAQESLDSFNETVRISQERYRAGDISEADLLKIKLQTLQFQTDVSSARVALIQAMASLRQLVGYESLPAQFQLAGDLEYRAFDSRIEDLQAAALRQRPDVVAARQGVTAAQSQITLAKANGKQDLDTSLSYSHVGGISSTSIFFGIPLPIFDRNQGEIARTRSALLQSQFTQKATEEQAMTEVRNAYEAAVTDQAVVKLYLSGYLKQAKDSRDITDYAYRKGAVALLDLLDAERSYRSTELGYRQGLANYMIALEQLKQSVGSRKLP